MTRDQLESEIIAFMTETFELEEGKVTTASKFEADLGLDSLDAVELALHLGDMTGAEIGEESLRKIVTVADVVDLVAQLQSEREAAATEGEPAAPEGAEAG